MEEYIYGLSYSDFFSLVDNMYDELLIYDKNCNIVYINRACSRHYGCDPKQMIGKNFYDFVHADWWGPSILPIVLKEKRAYAIKQSTFLGSELLTIAVPIFDKNNEIRFVVMNVRDIVNEVDLYNPHYLSIKDQPAKTPEPVYSSAEMQNVIQLIKRLAPLDTSCIFWGESPARERPCLPGICIRSAAVQESLLHMLTASTCRRIAGSRSCSARRTLPACFIT